MSEPKKQPAKSEPTTGKTPEGEAIKSDKKDSVTGDITPQAEPANTNEAKPADKDKKVEPVITAPITEISNEHSGDTAPEAVQPVEAGIETKAEAEAEAQPAASAADENVIPPAPVAEDSSGGAAPPSNDNPPADAPEQNHHGRLAKVFNFVASMAAGAAVTAVAKTAAVVGMTVAGAPAWATLVAAGLAVGVGATLYHDLRERGAKKKEGETLSSYFSAAHGKELFSKKNLKVFGISTVAAMVGSALMLGFHEGVIQDAWHGLWGGTPEPIPPVDVVPIIAPVIAPIEVAPPVELTPPVEIAPPIEEVIVPPVVVCLTPGEQFANLVQGHDVSSRVTDALTRAASTNAHVAAQGTKDLAFFAFNGFDGVPQSNEVAVELFKQAADAGNLQAKVDLLYMQYHGLGGLTADTQAATSSMSTLPGARAALFVESWGGVGDKAGAAFSTENVLKGLTVGCPTPA